MDNITLIDLLRCRGCGVNLHTLPPGQREHKPDCPVIAETEREVEEIYRSMYDLPGRGADL